MRVQDPIKLVIEQKKVLLGEEYPMRYLKKILYKDLKYSFHKIIVLLIV